MFESKTMDGWEVLLKISENYKLFVLFANLIDDSVSLYFLWVFVFPRYFVPFVNAIVFLVCMFFLSMCLFVYVFFSLSVFVRCLFNLVPRPISAFKMA